MVRCGVRLRAELRVRVHFRVRLSFSGVDKTNHIRNNGLINRFWVTFSFFRLMGVIQGVMQIVDALK